MLTSLNIERKVEYVLGKFNKQIYMHRQRPPYASYKLTLRPYKGAGGAKRA